MVNPFAQFDYTKQAFPYRSDYILPWHCRIHTHTQTRKLVINIMVKSLTFGLPKTASLHMYVTVVLFFFLSVCELLYQKSGRYCRYHRLHAVRIYSLYELTIRMSSHVWCLARKSSETIQSSKTKQKTECIYLILLFTRENFQSACHIWAILINENETSSYRSIFEIHWFPHSHRASFFDSLRE